APLGGYTDARQRTTRVATTGGTQTSGNSGMVSTFVGNSRLLVGSSTANNQADDTLDSTTPPDVGTLAFIGAGARVTAGGDLNVGAKETAKAEIKVGGGAVGIAAVGFAVADLTVQGNTEAYVEDNAVIDVAGGVTVTAGQNNDLTARGIAGQLGLGGAVGTQVATVNDKSNQRAYVKDAEIEA